MRLANLRRRSAVVLKQQTDDMLWHLAQQGRAQHISFELLAGASFRGLQAALKVAVVNDWTCVVLALLGAKVDAAAFFEDVPELNGYSIAYTMVVAAANQFGGVD